MQKVIHVSYSAGDNPYEERLKKVNSLLEEGWKVVSTYPINQFVSCDNGGWAAGAFGVTFILEKD